MENFIRESRFFNKSVVRLPEMELNARLLSGSNQKKILVVCLVSEEGQSIDDDFLKKIFKSVQIDLSNDTCLFMLPQHNGYSWKTIQSTIDFSHLVFFGNELSKLGLQVTAKPYLPFEFQERHFLIAEPLDVIADDRVKKGALWTALKQVFL